MKVTLDGKVALVTGAASGIGRATAKAISAAGVHALFLTDRDEEGCTATARTLTDAGTDVAHAAFDLSDPSAPAELAAAAIARFGRIDALVNAAGLTTRASFEDGTPETWEALFTVNARAPFFLMQAAIADMKGRAAPGTIVNILSINAHCGAPDLAIYSATKGALLTLTRNAANAHLADRIRVNGINLGWVNTEAEHHMQADILGKGENWADEASRHLPLKRLLEPEEAARHILFMLSDASAPMTGVTADLEQKVTGA